MQDFVNVNIECGISTEKNKTLKNSPVPIIYLVYTQVKRAFEGNNKHYYT